MVYRILQKSEYRVLAKIHLDAFQGFFLSSLGERFLRAYYKAVLASKETIGVGAVDDQGKMQGFGTGCVQSKGYHRRLLLRNLFTFLCHGLIILFKRPNALKQISENSDKILTDIDEGNYAEIFSLCVSNASKGNGIGRALIKTFEEEAKRKNCRKITLTTDFLNNEKVITFYLHSGYQVFYEFTAYPERPMYKLIKDL